MSALGPFAPPTAPDEQPAMPRRLLVGLLGVVLAAMLSSLDQRLSTVAANDILGGFDLGRDDGSWVATAYAIGDIAIVPLTPWLAQSLSPRRVLALEIALFALAAAGCPIAPNFSVLMGLRFLQGVGEGGLVPLMLLSLLRFAPARRRPEAFAIYALVTTLVPLIADPLAGLATDTFTWQSLFWISAVVAPLALGLVLAYLPVEPVKWHTFAETDYFGMLYLVLFATMLVAALGQGQRLDWFDDRLIVALFAGAAFFLAAFVVQELVTPDPLIDLSLFRRPNFSLGLMLVLVFNLGLLGATFVEPQAQTLLRGLKPLQIGQVFLLLIIPQLIFAPLAAALMRVLDARLLVAVGLGLACLGSYLSTYVTSVWSPGDFLLPLVIQACGWPLAFPPLVFLTTSVLKPQDARSGGTMFNVVRTLAVSAGPAIVNAVITVRERVHSNLLTTHLVPGSPATDARLARGGAQALVAAARAQAYTLSYADAFGWLSLLLLVGVLLVLFERQAPVTRAKG